MHLVQLRHPAHGRRVALVEESRLRLVEAASIHELAIAACRAGCSIAERLKAGLTDETLDYAAIYDGGAEWKLLPAFDHPDEPARCLVAGTGLTHTNSAKQRNAMHAAAADAAETDSMKMFRWGLEGGKPGAGVVGVQPEWFYKGRGECLRAHGEAIERPAFADDGGEEPELAFCYVIDDAGLPRRAGFCAGNEFSDHAMEKKNYLYLAPSKLRACAIGPELVVGEDPPGSIAGRVSVERGGRELWGAGVTTGEEKMCHSIANLEYHHFKYAAHRRPGDVHVHFLGADAFSFGAGIVLAAGDVMQVAWQGLGRPLRNTFAPEAGDVPDGLAAGIRAL